MCTCVGRLARASLVPLVVPHHIAQGRFCRASQFAQHMQVFLLSCCCSISSQPLCGLLGPLLQLSSSFAWL